MSGERAPVGRDSPLERAGTLMGGPVKGVVLTGPAGELSNPYPSRTAGVVAC
jgi:hypothetical protein